MAKDDYFVIVYKILAYLYTQLKSGDPVDPDLLMYDGKMFQINQKYWLYIIVNMLDAGYIKGISNPTSGNGIYIRDQLPFCQITPKGIEYLCDNSFIEKAKHFLKDIKEITPFI